MMKKVGQLYLVRHGFSVGQFDKQGLACEHQFDAGRLYMLTRISDSGISNSFSKWAFLNGTTEVEMHMSHKDFDHYFAENLCR